MRLDYMTSENIWSGGLLGAFRIPPEADGNGPVKLCRCECRARIVGYVV